MNTAFPYEVFQEIRRIQLQILRAVEGIFAGAYLSTFKGRGLEFEEVREYQAGDDVRTIDWNVTARMNTPFVKIFREEREITLNLLVDVSASMRFGSAAKQVREVIAILGGILALSAIENGDKVGLILFSDRIEKVVPPNKGKQQAMRIIRDLLLHKPKGKGTHIEEACFFFGRMRRRPSVCCLLSDFLSPPFSSAVELVAKRHEMIGFRIFDPLEAAFPSVGLVSMEEEETGQQHVVDTGSSRVLYGMQETMQQLMEEHRSLFRRLGSEFFEISSHEALVPAVQRFFAQRKRRHHR